MVMIDALNGQFGIPGVLVFETGEGGLTRAHVTTPACTAELYLHGAHLAAWQPVGTEPVLFLSGKSHFGPGVAIRGGIPVIFPWFGARTATPEMPRTDGPSHGFARTSEWQVSFAAAMGEGEDQVVHLALMLAADETSRALGYDNFRVAAQFTLGRTLSVKLTVANESDRPMSVSEALHTYLHVGDATQLAVYGLQGAEFLDKPDGFQRKVQTEEPLRFERETDRVYLNTEAVVRVEDPVLKRTLVVEKAGSQTTVVWNPWSELSAKLADMDDDGWRSMACVETANAAENALTIAPRSLHTMEARIHVEALSS
jgi:glucose-6-phosphate 1-epimerase